MASTRTSDDAIGEALATVADFIQQVTGIAPTREEIADALTRYFVLNEIKDHILMLRGGSG
jgi:aspartate/methionine/tyrosine aminotransferase